MDESFNGPLATSPSGHLVPSISGQLVRSISTRRPSGGACGVGCIKYTEYAFLWDSLKSGHVVLVKGTWLEEQFLKGNEVLPRRQDLPPEALWESEKLINRYERPKPGKRPPNLIVVSYCWYSKGHPDPEGEQMRLLGKILSWSHSCPFRSKESAVFLDWCSLFQAPRSDAEDKIFTEAMKLYINIWYAHAKTDVLMLTKVSENAENSRPYDERGWPTFEHSVSGLISQFRVSGDSGVYDIGRLTDAQLQAKCSSESWRSMHRTCVPGFKPPATPEVFNSLLEQKVFTCPDHDMGFCQRKYREVFEETTEGASELLYQGLEWGDDEVEELTGIFPNCRSVLILNLRDNWIGDRGAQCLARVLPSSLRNLSLQNNQIGDMGVEELSKELASGRCKRMRVIDLSGNSIGDGGVEFLAKAITHCEGLQHLYLSNNAFHDNGVIHLSNAIGHCSQLQRLDLDGNGVEASTADTIKWCWLKHRKVEDKLIITVEAKEEEERLPLFKLRQAISQASAAQRMFLRQSHSLTDFQAVGTTTTLNSTLKKALNASIFESMDLGTAVQHIVAKLKDSKNAEGQIEGAKLVQVLARGYEAQERLAEEQVLPLLLRMLSALFTPLRAAAASAIRSLVHGNVEVRRLAIRDGAIAGLVQQLSSEYVPLQECAAMALWSLTIGNSHTEFVKSKAVQPIVDLLKQCDKSQVLQKASVGLVMNLSSDTSTHPLLLSCGVVKPLITVFCMKECSMRLEVLTALRRLVECKKDEVDLVPVFLSAKAFPALVKHLSSEGMKKPAEQEAAIRTLRALVRDSSMARKAAVSSGALEQHALPAALDSAASSLLPVVMDTIWGCTGEKPDEMMQILGASVQRLVPALRFREHEVRAEAARVLQQTLESEERRMEAVEAGAVPLTVEMLGSLREEMQLAAAGLLRVLALSRDAKAIALEVGAVPLLCDCLWCGNMQILDAAARALRNLATDSNVKGAAGRAGAIPVLTTLMSAESVEVQEAAAGAIRNLVYRHGDNKQRAIGAKTLPSIVALMQSPFYAVQLQAVGALINLVSTSSDVELTRHVQDEAVKAGSIPALKALAQTEEQRLQEQAERALHYLAGEPGSSHALLPPMKPMSPWTTTRTRKAGCLGSPPERRTVSVPRHREVFGM